MNEPLRRTVQVRCPIAHAFDVFTARIDLWWPPGHRKFDKSALHLETKVDGRFLERSDQGAEFVMGTVLACEPPHKIRFSWNPGKITGPTEVDVSFEQDGPITTVNVLHSEADSALGEHWPQRAAIFTRGWDTVLPEFAKFCEATPVDPAL